MNYLAILLFTICFALYGLVIARKINYVRVVDQTLILIGVIGVGNYFYYKQMPLEWQLVFLVSLIIMRFAWIRFYGDKGSIYIFNSSKIYDGIHKLIKKHSKSISLTMKYKNQINYTITGDKEALKVFLKELNDYIAKNGRSGFSEYLVISLFLVLFVMMFL